MSEVTMQNMLERLKCYRILEGCSQQEFAGRLGIPQATYSEAETGRSILSYHILWGIYQYDVDIDYLFLGKERKKENDGLLKLLQTCNEEEARTLYIFLTEAFLQMWKWSMETTWERCLYSELMAANLLMRQKAPRCQKLQYIRIVNGFNKTQFAKELGVGRTKCGQCERGDTYLDADLMLRLYNKGYSLPSCYFEDYIGIREISGLLEQNEEFKYLYYDLMGAVVRCVLKNEKLCHCFCEIWGNTFGKDINCRGCTSTGDAFGKKHI